MAIGLVGRKRGMTRVFDDNGASVPVTVIEIQSNRVVQKKDVETDGYRALQVTTGSRRPSRVTKAEAGQFKKAGVEAGCGLWEFRVEGEWPSISSNDEEGAPVTLEVGSTLPVTMFSAGQFVDVIGRSLGKGFAGVIKRHNFRSQRSTHGNSRAHRAPGAIGQTQSPGHVFKGKKMSGQMGNTRTTIQNLEIVRVDSERGLILVRGGVPGSKNADVVIQPAVKKAG